MSASHQVAAHLRDVADDRLYRRNAFRVTGLATTADSREVRKQQKRMAAAAAVGAVPDGLAEGGAPDAEQLRTAFEAMADPARRLVHEVFWLWGEPTACRCAPAAHDVHDRAVAAHAEALDLELGAGDVVSTPEARTAVVDAWSRARRAWAVALDDFGVLLHVRHRVQALDDRRLEEDAAVRSLVSEVPRALVATIVARAANTDSGVRLMAQARQWELVTGEELDDLVLEQVTPRVESVRTGLGDARRRLTAALPDAALWSALDDLVDDVDRLDTVVPHHRFADLAGLRHELAVVLNNAALALVESGDGWDHDLVLSAFDDAVRLCTRDDSREQIVTNRDGALAAHETARRIAEIDRLLLPFGLRAADGGVQTLADRMIAAQRAGQYARAQRMVDALLQVVDDPAQHTELQQYRARLASARGGGPRTPMRDAVANYTVGVVAVAIVLLSIALGVGLDNEAIGLAVSFTAIPLGFLAQFLVDRRRR